MNLVNVPKFLQELHGESTTVLNISLVYVVGLIAAVISMLELIPKHIEIWKLVLVFILFIDIAGGVVSNMTFATNQYYQKRPNLKIVFIVAHIIQPFLLSIMFIEYWPYMLFVYLLTMISCIVLLQIKNSDSQRAISSVFLIIGIFGTMFLFKFDSSSMMVIGILYMIKLILGFSVKKDA
jgi:hypothetical protein